MKAILNNQITLSIAGGIGQSRTSMSILKKAHLGEVSATVWPQVLKDMCRKENIHVIEQPACHWHRRVADGLTDEDAPATV
jgi:aspartate--ammonia ligase